MSDHSMHAGMDHSNHNMNHSGHSMMDHGGHAGHSMQGMATTEAHDMAAAGHKMAAPGGHSGHEMMMVGGDSMNMDMQMYFHFATDATILFQDWKTSSAGGLFASCLGIFLLAMLYEGLKYYREFLFRRQYSSTRYSTVNIPQEDGKVIVADGPYSLKTAMLSGNHALQTGLHMVQVTVSYFLMLIFMTYNVWLCMAVVLGAGCGYFLFGWKKAMVVDITEHCH